MLYTDGRRFLNSGSQHFQRRYRESLETRRGLRAWHAKRELTVNTGNPFHSIGCCSAVARGETQEQSDDEKEVRGLVVP
jgi:hypothetical protein